MNDETFERHARRIIDVLWSYRHKDTGILGFIIFLIILFTYFFFLGNLINIQTGEWEGILSGLGAGLDSFYEYLLKSHILFGEQHDLKLFGEAKRQIEHNLRRGRPKCRFGNLILIFFFVIVNLLVF